MNDGRHCPSVVRMASQTLLSSRMRTRQGEDFLLGQALLARQAVKSGQEPVQLAFVRKEMVQQPGRLGFGQAADSLNHFGGGHDEKGSPFSAWRKLKP